MTSTISVHDTGATTHPPADSGVPRTMAHGAIVTATPAPGTPAPGTESPGTATSDTVPPSSIKIAPGRERKGLRTVTKPAPLPEVPVPVDQAGIDTLRMEIDALDAQLVTLIQRRTAISHAIGAARASLGGTRIVYSREMAVLDKFRALGSAGTDLGMLLLSMGRGQLGRR